MNVTCIVIESLDRPGREVEIKFSATETVGGVKKRLAVQIGYHSRMQMYTFYDRGLEREDDATMNTLDIQPNGFLFVFCLGVDPLIERHCGRSMSTGYVGRMKIRIIEIEYGRHRCEVDVEVGAMDTVEDFKRRLLEQWHAPLRELQTFIRLRTFGFVGTDGVNQYQEPCYHTRLVDGTTLAERDYHVQPGRILLAEVCGSLEEANSMVHGASNEVSTKMVHESEARDPSDERLSLPKEQGRGSADREPDGEHLVPSVPARDVKNEVFSDEDSSDKGPGSMCCDVCNRRRLNHMFAPEMVVRWGNSEKKSCAGGALATYRGKADAQWRLT